MANTKLSKNIISFVGAGKVHPIGTVAPIVNEYINKSRLLNGDLRHGHLGFRHIAGGGYPEKAFLSGWIKVRIEDDILQVGRRKGCSTPAAETVLKITIALFSDERF
jgi:hypothetical protein